MSRIYGCTEPMVIDESLIKEAILVQLPGDPKPKTEDIDLTEVDVLHLDFKNILKIDHLWVMKSLVKLKLDNNVIKRIEGLDHLINLRWLDLSFNNIENIEGLESLVNIEDLALYNNQISSLENLDTLKKLQVLSIGNNNLSELQCLIYLRRFPRLQSLCLRGNPVCKHADYWNSLHAFLPNLVYVEYRRADDQLKELAYQQFHLEVDRLTHDESEQAKSAAMMKEANAMKTLHRAAHVEGFDDPGIFDRLYDDDPEGRQLLQLSCLSAVVENFRVAFAARFKMVFDFGLEELRKRQTEVDEFQQCLNKAKLTNAQTGTQLSENFKEFQCKSFQEIESTTNSAELDLLEKAHNEHIQKLWYDLMQNEVNLVEQISELTMEFGLNLKELVDHFTEIVQGHFSEFRELQGQFNENLTESCLNVMEKVQRISSDVVYSDATVEMFMDKDSWTNAVQYSHDAHLLYMDNMSDKIINQVARWYKDLMECYHEAEHRRNRNRVIEINRCIEALKSDLQEKMNAERPESVEEQLF